MKEMVRSKKCVFKGKMDLKSDVKVRVNLGDDKRI
jgi:hypothetical protein